MKDLRKYNFTFLLNEEKEIKKLKELMTSFKIKLVKEEDWGEKTLAYPIKKNKTAHFYHWLLEINPEILKDFKKNLSYNIKLIRYLLLAN